MNSFQQHILSLQAQFNSFYVQIENLKNQPEEKAVFTDGTIASFARIQKKACDLTQQAAKENSPTTAKIEYLSRLLQTLGGEVPYAKGVEALKRLHTQGTAIKTSLQEIYFAHFNVSNVEKQTARVTAENDQTMAGNDFIVQRACNQAQVQFPKTYSFFVACIKEVNRGLCGKELQEALEMCLPSIWSLEALLKLALVRLSQKNLPLTSLDCFVLDEANLATFTQKLMKCFLWGRTF